MSTLALCAFAVSSLTVGLASAAIALAANEPNQASEAGSAESETLVTLHEAEYFQKNGDYPMAIARFREAIATSASSPAGKDARLGLARLQFQMKRYPDAVETLRSFLEQFPDDRHKSTATYMLATSLRASGKSTESIQQFIEYARMGGVLSAYAQAQLGDIYLEMGQPSRATAHLAQAVEQGLPLVFARDVMENLVSAYTALGDNAEVQSWRQKQLQGAQAPGYGSGNVGPVGDAADDALFRRGLDHYRTGDLPSAVTAWENSLKSSPSSNTRTKVQFWLGKTLLEVGETQAAAGYLRSAAGAQAWDYYGVRAREYIESRVGSFSGEYLLDVSQVSAESPEERAAFEEWLATWSGQPPYAFDRSYRKLGGDQGFKRLQELVRVGSRGEARKEIEGLRRKHRGDPVALYEMLMYLNSQEFFQLSILTADDIVGLSPASSAHVAPRFLQKMVYPVHFAELILHEARKLGVDPLLLSAIIRQESMFDQRAESSADARGLGQVMPATGSAIARSLQMGRFDEDELFKPYISVSFGAYYFAAQLRSYGENPFFALAAYNAGSGMVRVWMADNPARDVDLFVEDIQFAETRTYIRRVYFYYDLYRQIWARRS